MRRLSGGAFCLLLVLLSGAETTAQQLNPTVKVLREATAPVPPDCDDQATPAPRIEVERIPPSRPEVVAMPAPPPSSDLRSSLQALHAAVAARDRASFDATMARTKQLLSSYPPGGERTAATDAMAVFDEIGRLWNYQTNTPTGSFFDATAEGGALLRMLTKYPGYEEAMRRQVIVDAAGNRFYPTRESTEFLLNVAAQRLGRVGATVEQRATMPRQPAPQPRVTTPSPVPSTATAQPRATTPQPRATRPQPRAASAQRPSARRSTPSPQTKQPATSPAPAPAPAPVSDPVPAAAAAAEEPDLALPAPVVTAPSDPASDTAPPPAVTAPSDPASDTAPPPAVTDTSTTAFPTTAADQTLEQDVQDPATPRQKRRSIILPIVLILIGVGVLILLFRASS